ncbi:MAG: hypothetical protein ACREHG_10755, partial [Candidatus Saccharimonadales bacterium]
TREQLTTLSISEVSGLDGATDTMTAFATPEALASEAHVGATAITAWSVETQELARTSVFDRLRGTTTGNFLTRTAVVLASIGGGSAIAGATAGEALAARAHNANHQAGSAGIVVGKSIDGVIIGATPAQLRHDIGSPAYTRGKSVWQYGKNSIGAIVSFGKGHVTGVWTPDKHLKTNKGIGVGSSVSEVEKAYPKAKCTPGAGPTGGSKSLACVIKAGHGQQAVETIFDFAFRSEGVEEVAIDRA